ncbi:HAD-superfamily hydrolase, subfamily IA,variant1 family [[Clostridium] ultunense Esp]|nr:HAD-superfamily hydrolase, subfamily IA,variant1 family [[Clostridium] ultunense Esp]
MNLQSLKVIGFDLGYTLVRNRRERIYQGFLKENGIDLSIHSIEKAFHLADKTFMRLFPGALGKPAKTFYPWWLGIVNYHLELQFDLVKQTQYFFAHQDRESFWELFPWTESVLKELKKAGYRLILLSNWDNGARSLIKRLGLTPYFDDLLISAELGIQKPDPKIFIEMVKRAQCRPEEVLYVGDNYYDDVAGAKKAGIDTVLINRFGRLGIEEIDHHPVIADTRELIQLLQLNGERLEHAI